MPKRIQRSRYLYCYLVDGELWMLARAGPRDRKHLIHARRFAKGLPMHRIHGWQRELAERIKAGSTVVIKRMAENLSEREALDRERELIADLKPRKSMLPGGQGGRLRTPIPGREG